MVDISGLDRMELLKALWENSKPAMYFAATKQQPPSFDGEAARRCAGRNGFVDYASGRSIKVNVFGKDTVVSPDGYDQNNGEGSFRRVVDALRQRNAV